MEVKTSDHPLLHNQPRVSERVRDLKPYDPVSSLDRIKNNPAITHFKLDWNETTIPPSPEVKNALLEYLNNGSRLEWYPEMYSKVLFDRLSEYAGCRASQLLVTNGSDDALDLICQSYLDSTDNVVSPVPTYNHFLQFAQRTGAEVKKVPGESAWFHSLKDISRAVDENTKIVYLVNPNNPTGNVYSPAEVYQLAKRHPNVLFISDEAYYEFAQVSCARLVDELDNLVVTRSFSKCFGLAGLRIGYLMAPEPVIKNLRRVFNPKSVNIMAQIAAVAALGDLPYYRRYVRQVKRSAALVKEFCERRGIPCRPTYANFILVQFENAPEMARKLADVGVHIRDRSKYLPGTLRFGLGTEEQTQEVLSRLGKLLDDPATR